MLGQLPLPTRHTIAPMRQAVSQIRMSSEAWKDLSFVLGDDGKIRENGHVAFLRANAIQDNLAQIPLL